MSQEIELKFRISRKAIEQLPVFIESLQVRHEASHVVHQISHYLDTPELLLQQKGIALRLRKEGNQYIQTLKRENSVHQGLHQRDEYEEKIEGMHVELNKLPKTFRDLLAPIKDQLHCIFSTEFDRTIWLLKLNEGTTIECALDIGRVVAKDHKEKFAELELELKEGSIDSLLEIAAKFKSALELIPENKSKAERGYALYETR
ncbi:MAG: CYTH domain-containing protein [Pseudomonadota bacterium]